MTTANRLQAWRNSVAVNALARRLLLTQAIGASSVMEATVYDDVVSVSGVLTGALDAEARRHYAAAAETLALLPETPATTAPTSPTAGASTVFDEVPTDGHGAAPPETLAELDRSLLTALTEALPGFAAHPINTATSPAAAMAEWLVSGEKTESVIDTSGRPTSSA